MCGDFTYLVRSASDVTVIHCHAPDLLYYLIISVRYRSHSLICGYVISKSINQCILDYITYITLNVSVI